MAKRLDIEDFFREIDPDLCQYAYICLLLLLETGFVPFSQNKFPGLFQDSKIHTNPCSPKISLLILLPVCHTFQFSHLSLTNFQHFPGPVALFQDFPDLENTTVKFQDFSGFPGPIRTL